VKCDGKDFGAAKNKIEKIIITQQKPNMNQLLYMFDRTQLAETRIQLHYAIQPLAATSLALVKAQPDFSHMALYWDDNLGFSTQPIPSIQHCRIVLNPVTLNLEVVGYRDQVIAIFALSNRALSEAFDWIRTVVKKLGGRELVTPISYPEDDFPDSDLAHIATFNRQFPSSILADYYASANQILQALIQSEPLAAPVRIWSHHFDIATLITLPNQKDGDALTIGVGLSPGDRSYEEPYWYVTPYPYPKDRRNLPSLDGNGTWHTSHWLGAVLTASQFARPNISPSDSIAQVKSFLNSAIAGCKHLLT